MPRGRLVVFEGAEGVGKSTQVARLVEALARAGIRARAFREPGGTPLGDEIRALLLSPGEGPIAPAAEALLFMAARAQLMERVEALLRDGQTVILDRFFLSTYAYQVAGRGLPLGEVREANRLAVRGARPDVTLLLTLDLDVARRRMTARGDLDRIEQEAAGFHRRVADAFLAAADPVWQRQVPEIGVVERMDASGTPDDVARRIQDALARRFPETFAALHESH